MKLSDLLRNIDILHAGADLEMEITGVSYDSRHTKPGDLFVAMTGFATDGHRFIPAAVEKGAVCVLCQTPPAGAVPYVQVADSRRAPPRAGACTARAGQPGIGRSVQPVRRFALPGE